MSSLKSSLLFFNKLRYLIFVRECNKKYAIHNVRITKTIQIMTKELERLFIINQGPIHLIYTFRKK